MNNNNVYEDDTIEIDLREILYAIRKWIVVICLTGILGGVAGFAATKLFMTPIYTAENSMLILTKETTLTSLADLQLGKQLTNDYTYLTTSRPVLEAVIEKLDLKMSYNQLKGSIRMTNPDDTRVLIIKVVSTNPKLALDIARTVADVASNYIGDMMEVIPPKVIDEGVVPANPTSPSTTKNTALGILLGLVVSCGIVTLQVILDDTIKSEEDIEKRLGLSTLSLVPDRKDYINQSKEKSSDKKLLSKIKKGL